MWNDSWSKIRVARVQLCSAVWVRRGEKCFSLAAFVVHVLLRYILDSATQAQGVRYGVERLEDAKQEFTYRLLQNLFERPTMRWCLVDSLSCDSLAYGELLYCHLFHFHPFKTGQVRAETQPHPHPSNMALTRLSFYPSRARARIWRLWVPPDRDRMQADYRKV